MSYDLKMLSSHINPEYDYVSKITEHASPVQRALVNRVAEVAKTEAVGD